MGALLRTHLCRAEPLMSINSSAYFIDELTRLESNYEKKVKAREHLAKFLKHVIDVFRGTRITRALKGEIQRSKSMVSNPFDDSDGESNDEEENELQAPSMILTASRSTKRLWKGLQPLNSLEEKYDPWEGLRQFDRCLTRVIRTDID